MEGIDMILVNFEYKHRLIRDDRKAVILLSFSETIKRAGGYPPASCLWRKKT